MEGFVCDIAVAGTPRWPTSSAASRRSCGDYFSARLGAPVGTRTPGSLAVVTGPQFAGGNVQRHVQTHARP